MSTSPDTSIEPYLVLVYQVETLAEAALSMVLR